MSDSGREGNAKGAEEGKWRKRGIGQRLYDSEPRKVEQDSKVQDRKKNGIGSSTTGTKMRGRGKRRRIEEDTETVKIIEEWQEENMRRYREKEIQIRMEGKITQNIWRNLKEGVKRCVIMKQVKIGEGRQEIKYSEMQSARKKKK